MLSSVISHPVSAPQVSSLSACLRNSGLSTHTNEVSCRAACALPTPMEGGKSRAVETSLVCAIAHGQCAWHLSSLLIDWVECTLKLVPRTSLQPGFEQKRVGRACSILRYDILLMNDNIDSRD